MKFAGFNLKKGKCLGEYSINNKDHFLQVFTPEYQYNGAGDFSLEFNMFSKYESIIEFEFCLDAPTLKQLEKKFITRLENEIIKASGRLEKQYISDNNKLDSLLLFKCSS